MALHAEQTVYWPQYKEDVINRRLSCSGCGTAAPSQPAPPPSPLPSPEYPAHMISVDYFLYSGSSYFVIIDRYSKWISIYTAKNENAKELLTVFKNYYSTFGISCEVASDGGAQFV